jgi:hypothetical protein
MASAQIEPAPAHGALETGVARHTAARRRGGLTLQRRESLIAYASLIPAFLLVAGDLVSGDADALPRFHRRNGAKSTGSAGELREDLYEW